MRVGALAAARVTRHSLPLSARRRSLLVVCDERMLGFVLRSARTAVIAGELTGAMAGSP